MYITRSSIGIIYKMTGCISGVINYCDLVQVIFIYLVFVGLPLVFGIWAIASAKTKIVNKLTGAFAIKSVLVPIWILLFYLADITIPSFEIRMLIRYLPDLFFTIVILFMYNNAFRESRISWLLIGVEIIRFIGFASFERQLSDFVDLNGYFFCSLTFVYLFLVPAVVLFRREGNIN